jgi:hypothetical protein
LLQRRHLGGAPQQLVQALLRQLGRRGSGRAILGRQRQRALDRQHRLTRLPQLPLEHLALAQVEGRLGRRIAHVLRQAAQRGRELFAAAEPREDTHLLACAATFGPERQRAPRRPAPAQGAQPAQRQARASTSSALARVGFARRPPRASTSTSASVFLRRSWRASPASAGRNAGATVQHGLVGRMASSSAAARLRRVVAAR